MIELCKQFRFDAAHTLHRVIESETSRRLHGHSYRAEVALRGEPDRESGMLMDLGLFERAIGDVASALHNRFLDEMNDLGPATLENLSMWIWRKLETVCPGLWRVTVLRDSSGDKCSYFGGEVTTDAA